MHGDVAMPFFVPIVLWHIVQIVTTNDHCALHFGGDDNALEDPPADGNVAGEGAFLINVSALDCLLGRLEAQSNVFVVAHAGSCLLGQQLLAVEEHVLLLLEGTFMLNRLR